MLLSKEQKKEKPQLGLNLKFSRLEFLYKLKRINRRIEKNFTVLPFWRNGMIWAAIAFIIGITTIITLTIARKYSALPPEVPLIYDTVSEKWQSFPKMFFFAVPIALIVIGIIIIQLLQKVYYMNKRLTLMICLIICMIYLLSLLAVNEIILFSTT